MRWRIQMPRFRMMTLLGLIAAIAVGLGAWREYSSPRAVWRRASRNEESNIRRWTWDSILQGRIPGLTPEESVAEIHVALEDPDRDVRTFAMRHYPGFPVATREAFARLAPWLREGEDEQDRESATRAVGLIAERGEDGLDLVMPGLLRSLESPRGSVPLRRAALDSLAWIAHRYPARHDALLDLISIRLEDPNEDVRLAAALALSRTDEEGLAYPILKAYFLAHLDELDPKGLAPIPFRSAIVALGEIAGQSDEAAQFLLSQVYRKGEGFWYDEDDLQDIGDWFVATTAIDRWLPYRGTPGRARIDALAREALDGDDPDLRLGAAFVLRGAGMGPRLVPEWLAALHHEKWFVRWQAAGNLSEFGLAHPSVIPALREASNDPNAEVRMMVAASLRDLGE
jgi:HEAT repeat protein